MQSKAPFIPLCFHAKTEQISSVVCLAFTLLHSENGAFNDAHENAWIFKLMCFENFFSLNAKKRYSLLGV